ncbi:fimbrial protein [Burkholderia sp. PU8-34]
MSAQGVTTGAPAAGPASLDGFNLLPYRDRIARAMRRRRAAQCGAAILLGAAGVGVWTGGAAWLRVRTDAERARVDARLLRQQPQVDAAVRAARSAAAAALRSGQAAALVAPYRQAVELLALLAQVRDDEVRLDALRATPFGAELDARATSYRAAATWFARLEHEPQRWRVDVDVLKPAPPEPGGAGGAARMPYRFSGQLRRQDAPSHPAPPEGHR